MSSTFAFTVHPRAGLSEDLARVWSHIGGSLVGHVVLVPFGHATCSPLPAKAAPAFTGRSTRPGPSAAMLWGSAL